MATVLTVGRVDYLWVGTRYGTDFGLVNIQLRQPSGWTLPVIPPGPKSELFFIWSGVHNQVAKGFLLPELSRALAHGLQVTIFHEEWSAYIDQLIIEAPFEGSLV